MYDIHLGTFPMFELPCYYCDGDISDRWLWLEITKEYSRMIYPPRVFHPYMECFWRYLLGELENGRSPILKLRKNPRRWVLT